MNINEIIEGINAIEDESQLHVLWDVIKDRRKNLQQLEARKAVASIKAGDIVELHGLSPKYLNGAICTVRRIEGTKFHVNVIEDRTFDPRAASRLAHATVPASCVTKLEA